LVSRARETCSGRLVGAAAGGGTMVRSAAAPAAFLFSGLLVVDSGATTELGRPGMTTSASMVAAPIERGEVRGHRQPIGKSAALIEGALALARAARRH